MKRMMINEGFLKDAMPPSHFRAFVSFLKHEDTPKIGCTKISTSLDSEGRGDALDLHATLIQVHFEALYEKDDD